MKKISNLLMMALLTIGMGLTSCDEQLDNAVTPSGVTPVVDEKGEVTSIEVDLSKIDAKYLDSEKTKLQLTVGNVVTLSFTILPEEAAGTEVELTADDATILSIDGLKVTVKKAGETKVTAKAGDATAEIPVTVVAKEPVDLSMVDNAGNAREKQWTANCYMVHTAGDYKLPLVYGNAIKDGAANTDAYTGIDNANTTLTFPNHAGNAINAPWITKATTGTGTLGTDYQVYKVTPVNLGWVSTSPDGKQGYNTYYQWGRKDAFIPGTWNSTTNHTVYDIDGNTVATPLTCTESTDATIADNIKNPTTHYYNSSTHGPCDTKYYNMWDAQQTATGNITTATKKTVYDPCPAGFCVPTGNLYHFMSRSDSNWDGTNIGKTWLQTTYSSNTTGPDLYFPASGHRKNDGGWLKDVDGDNSGGYCWSASPGGDSSHSLDFRSNVWGLGNNHRANGFPVRAVAEE